MLTGSSVLVVDGDRDYARALALLLRREGHRVRVVRTRAQALLASSHERYDLAIVDLFVGGGGAELARLLSRRVGELLLSLAPRMARAEVLEAALGFPVLRKAVLPSRLKGLGARRRRTLSARSEKHEPRARSRDAL
jgi:DNA-binding response OmpR family regulator